MKIDFGRTAKDYSLFRAGYPDELYKRLRRINIGSDGQSILDLGTGTGYLARRFSEQGARVTGVDISEELINAAKELDNEKGLKIKYVKARAEELPFHAPTFDVVTAGQCWHWFQGEKVMNEIRRVLKKNGKLVIVHLDWLPLKDNIVMKTEELILSYNPNWTGAGGTGVYPDWLTQVANGGFKNIETFTFDLDITYSQEAWRGRIRASAGVGASLDKETVKAFDHDLKILLESNYRESIDIPHRVFCLVCSKPQ
ncbi:class I SAM-dependent methyltransferase [Bacillus kexueae]|uniref:class I SAM-dependent methyltransferase n=1 Tax=Aeribacillus kexueae TaxID=2078952 RepID=UPI001FB008E4|nr:class I SAM-dependent methyltransferase [Bacillus kexueae]